MSRPHEWFGYYDEYGEKHRVRKFEISRHTESKILKQVWYRHKQASADQRRNINV